MEDMSGWDYQGPVGVAPLELQLDVLGLTQPLLKKLKKDRLKTLDIGCGETYELVKFLKKTGVNAEGLDPRIKEERKYLIGMGLPKGSKEKDKIMPRPNEYYDLIFSHCMDYFYNAIRIPESAEDKSTQELEKLIEKQPRTHIHRSNFAILESLRMLKPNSDLIIYPSINQIPNMQKTLEEINCTLEQQPIDEKLAQKIQNKYWRIYSWFETPIQKGDYQFRTIIHKLD